jgi:CRP-like cAMP-binding protein
MLDLLAKLEPRFFEAKKVIFRELDECQEFYFVLKGGYMAGYGLNNRNHYRLRFGPGSLLATFNVLFNKRSYFILKSSSFMECFGCRRQNLKELL